MFLADKAQVIGAWCGVLSGGKFPRTTYIAHETNRVHRSARWSLWETICRGHIVAQSGAWAEIDKNR